MAVEGLLIGGRYDGGLLPKRERNTFTFVGGDDREPRHYAKAGPGRELYRSLGIEERNVRGIEKRVELMLYAGHTHRLCECGSYIEQSQWAMHAACTEAAAA